MTGRTARVARANLRVWWKEAIFAGLCVVIWKYAGGLGDSLAVVIAVGVGWAMGFSHRHGPIFQIIRRMDAKLDAALADDERPLAEVRHLRSL